ncbi:MAG: OmpA family protein, partial [Deltaproteobacteria bacterium]|nr:OmpA family protein [Deltaproteobacteria bacterium]
IRRLEIQTHHDSGIGPDKAMALTEKQGEAIVSYLRKQGIDPGRMNVAPKGASQPKVPNIGEKNRRKNRRVELRLL